MTYTLQLSQWRIQRGREVNLGPFDLDLWPGEVCTCMGPSGVGKTTFLLSLLGYEDPGLLVEGLRCYKERELPPGVIPPDALYIPQRLPFNPNWEVSSFLSALPWRGQNSPSRRQRKKRVQSALKTLGLGSRARATLAELSGGESQRAALAQLFILEPSLLIADEFVSGLDPGLTMWTLEECRRLIKANSGTAVLALHDIHSALHVSDRILLFWPHTVCRQPWELTRRASWSADSIYALLCLARWFKDVQPSSVTPAFLQVVRKWTETEALPEIGIAAAKEAGIWIMTGAEDYIEAPFPVEEAWKQELLRWGPAEVVPLRLSCGGFLFLGLSAVTKKGQRVAIVNRLDLDLELL